MNQDKEVTALLAVLRAQVQELRTGRLLAVSSMAVLNDLSSEATMLKADIVK